MMAFNIQKTSALLKIQKKLNQVFQRKNLSTIDLVQILAQNKLPKKLPPVIKNYQDQWDFFLSQLQGQKLLLRIKRELGDLEILDRPIYLSHHNYRQMYVPKGLVGHVLPGNSLISALESWYCGIITKGIHLFKISSQHEVFFSWFEKQWKNSPVENTYAFVSFTSDREDLIQSFCEQVNHLILWGSAQSLETYLKLAPPLLTKTLHGPKVSFAVIEPGLQHKQLIKAFQQLALDVSRFDQLSCASVQNLFLHQSYADQAPLLKKAFEELPPLENQSQNLDKLKEFHLALHDHSQDGQTLSFFSHQQNHTLLVCKDFGPSSLYRSLRIIFYKNHQDILKKINPFRTFLQSAMLLNLSSSLASLLLRNGVSRLAKLGAGDFHPSSNPHEGQFPLQELVSLVSLDDISCMARGGHHFLSGGTTGKPKLSYYPHEEFELSCQLMAQKLRAYGLGPSKVVANLFMAGHLWSSFQAINLSLKYLEVDILPMGGLMSPEEMLAIFDKKSPHILFGIPSTLIKLAKTIEKERQNKSYPIEAIFYAGERLGIADEKYLKKIFPQCLIRSASYATVELGLIGYQCPDCKKDEHHLYWPWVEGNFEGEIAVKTMLKKDFSLQLHKTGDLAMPALQGKCNDSFKFKLLGRSDKKVQIWTCRFDLQEIKHWLKQNFTSVETPFQLQIHGRNHQHNHDQLKLIIKTSIKKKTNIHKLKKNFFEVVGDLSESLNWEEFDNNFNLEMGQEVSFIQSPRTHKKPEILDLRKF